MILVVFAMREEGETFLRWLDDQSTVVRRQIQVRIVGVGAEAVRKRFPSLLEELKPDCVLAAGFAGSLKDDLEIGEVFHANNLSTLLSDPMFPGKILVSSDTLENLLEQRKSLSLKSGADLVDMESSALAEVAARQGVPILILKVISDTALRPIPVPFTITYDLEKQRVQILKTLYWLAAHPFLWVAFVQFVRDLSKMRQNLSDAVVICLRRSLRESE